MDVRGNPRVNLCHVHYGQPCEYTVRFNWSCGNDNECFLYGHCHSLRHWSIPNVHEVSKFLSSILRGVVFVTSSSFLCTSAQVSVIEDSRRLDLTNYFKCECLHVCVFVTTSDWNGWRDLDECQLTSTKLRYCPTNIVNWRLHRLLIQSEK